MTELIYPVKIILKSDGVNGENVLFKEEYPQIGLSEPNLCEIPSGGSIILDFEKEYVGGIRILAYTECKSLRIRVGESVTETCAELGENGACNDHSLRDITVYIPAYSDSVYFKSGFRFCRIDNLGSESVRLKKVLLTYTHTGLTQKGFFKCNDERLNEIFDVAARTVYLNVQNGVIYDGIKRDRLVWVGDLHPEFLSYLGLYDDYSCLRNSLEFSISQTVPPAWVNGIPAYSMWLIIVLNEYLKHTGDVEFLEKHIDYIENTARFICDNVTSDGKLKYEFVFLDWPSQNFEDKGYAGNVALAYMTMSALSEMFAKCGKDDSFIRLTANALKDNNVEFCDYKQGAALRTFAGLNQDASVLVKDGVKGFSTFMSYYILDSIAKKYGVATATEMLKNYYGGMLDLGATTFFEDFDVEWLNNAARIDEFPDGKVDVHATYGDFCYKGFRHSFCHGWASGPVQYLQRTVAGVKVIDDRTIELKPDLGNLEWLKVGFPTPYGLVKIECDKNGLKVDSPKEVTVIER